MSEKKRRRFPRTEREKTAYKATVKAAGKKGTTSKRKKQQSVGTKPTQRGGGTSGRNIFIASTGNHTSGTNNFPCYHYPSLKNDAYIAELRERFASTTTGLCDIQMKGPYRGTWYRRAIRATFGSIRKMLGWCSSL